MILELGFGPGVQTVSVPDENILGILAPNAVTVDLTGEAEVKRALEAPIGSPRLKDMVKPGEKIAFVGATGAGKKTITNLINRFYDIEDGEILIDGLPLKSYSREYLRKNIAMVLQDTHLTSHTLHAMRS